MNKLDNIKNYNSDDFDSDEFDTDSELDSCDL